MWAWDIRAGGVCGHTHFRYNRKSGDERPARPVIPEVGPPTASRGARTPPETADLGEAPSGSCGQPQVRLARTGDRTPLVGSDVPCAEWGGNIRATHQPEHSFPPRPTSELKGTSILDDIITLQTETHGLRSRMASSPHRSHQSDSSSAVRRELGAKVKPTTTVDELICKVVAEDGEEATMLASGNAAESAFGVEEYQLHVQQVVDDFTNVLDPGECVKEWKRHYELLKQKGGRRQATQPVQGGGGIPGRQGSVGVPETHVWLGPDHGLRRGRIQQQGAVEAVEAVPGREPHRGPGGEVCDKSVTAPPRSGSWPG